MYSGEGQENISQSPKTPDQLRSFGPQGEVIFTKIDYREDKRARVVIDDVKESMIKRFRIIPDDQSISPYSLIQEKTQNSRKITAFHMTGKDKIVSISHTPIDIEDENVESNEIEDILDLKAEDIQKPLKYITGHYVNDGGLAAIEFSVGVDNGSSEIPAYFVLDFRSGISVDGRHFMREIRLDPKGRPISREPKLLNLQYAYRGEWLYGVVARNQDEQSYYRVCLAQSMKPNSVVDARFDRNLNITTAFNLAFDQNYYPDRPNKLSKDNIHWLNVIDIIKSDFSRVPPAEAA